MADDMMQDMAADLPGFSGAADLSDAERTLPADAAEPALTESAESVNNALLEGEDPEKGAEPSYKGEQAFWYVVHTYSGYENKVKRTLEMIVENRGIQDYIQEIFIPTEEVTEIKDGKKKVTQKKIYPGYVMIKMVLTDEIWYIVRNTRGVTGFVGPNSKPVPLADEELAIMGMDVDWVPVVDYKVGDSVKIIKGPFESHVGVVQEIDQAKNRVCVLILLFGTDTPVTLELTQVVRL